MQPMPSTNPKFIVVDDDDFMRQMIVDTLDIYGVRPENVRAFGGGARAHDYLMEATPAGAIVICDLAMPTLSGLDLYRAVHPHQPDLTFIFVSGLQLSLSEQRFLKEEDLPLLAKPFTPEQLIALLEKTTP